MNCPKCQVETYEMKFEGVEVEDIAANIGDARSKIMTACKYFKENGYKILGVR